MYFVNVLGTELEVWFTHYRWNKQKSEDIERLLCYLKNKKGVKIPSNFSDFTHCELICRSKHRIGGVCVAEGVAFCSKEDNFSRKIGRDLSFIRAIKEYFDTQELYVQHSINIGKPDLSVSYYK